MNPYLKKYNNGGKTKEKNLPVEPPMIYSWGTGSYVPPTAQVTSSFGSGHSQTQPSILTTVPVSAAEIENRKKAELVAIARNAEEKQKIKEKEIVPGIQQKNVSIDNTYTGVNPFMTSFGNVTERTLDEELKRKQLFESYSKNTLQALNDVVGNVGSGLLYSTGEAFTAPFSAATEGFNYISGKPYNFQDAVPNATRIALNASGQREDLNNYTYSDGSKMGQQKTMTELLGIDRKDNQTGALIADVFTPTLPFSAIGKAFTSANKIKYAPKETALTRAIDDPYKYVTKELNPYVSGIDQNVGLKFADQTIDATKALQKNQNAVNEIINADDVEVWNHNTKKFEPIKSFQGKQSILPESSMTTVAKATDDVDAQIPNAKEIKQITAYKNDLLNRLKTTEEGKRRLANFGLTPEDINDIDLNFNAGGSRALYGKIDITGNPYVNIDFKQIAENADLGLKPMNTAAHEIAHALQYLAAKKRYNAGVNPTDFRYNWKDLNKTPADQEMLDWLTKNVDKSYEPFPGWFDQFPGIDKSLLKKTPKQGASYLTAKAEPYAHLREFRANMIDEGILKNEWDNVTEDMVDKFMKTSSTDRMKGFMENTSDFRKRMSMLLNKYPAVIPAAIGTGAAGASMMQQPKEKFRTGGAVNPYIKEYKNGGKGDPEDPTYTYSWSAGSNPASTTQMPPLNKDYAVGTTVPSVNIPVELSAIQKEQNAIRKQQQEKEAQRQQYIAQMREKNKYVPGKGKTNALGFMGLPDPNDIRVLAMNKAASDVAEFTGVPGAIRFLKDPVTKLQDLGSAAETFIIDSNSMPSGTMQQIKPMDYKPEGIQAFTDVLDFAGLSAPFVGPLISAGSEGLGMAGKYLTTKTPIKNTWMLNPYASRLGKYNRVVGSDAIEDIYNSGLVRSGQYGGVDRGSVGGISLNRTTPYPSFTYGKPSQTYINQTIDQGKNPFVISTDRPMTESTLGRHGKGSTMFPVDESGKFLESFPATQVELFEPIPHWYKGYQKTFNPYSKDIQEAATKYLADEKFSKADYAIYTKMQEEKRKQLDALRKKGLDYNSQEWKNVIKENTVKEEKWLYNSELNRLKRTGMDKYFSSPIGAGSYGQVYPFKDNPNLLYKIGLLNPMEDEKSIENLMNIGREINNPNISLPKSLSLVQKNTSPSLNKYGQVINKVSGKDYGNYVGEFPKSSIDELEKNLIELRNKGVEADYIGRNIFYNPETKKFSVFDLNTSPLMSKDFLSKERWINDVNKVNTEIPEILKKLSIFKNGGLVDPVDPEDKEAAMRGMMKARMAIDSTLGRNPAAMRMTSVNPKEYIFTGDEMFYDEKQNIPAGATGTHYTTGEGNVMFPIIQEGQDGNLFFNRYASPTDREAMRFETPEEASYFGENYKSIAPMMYNERPTQEDRKKMEKDIRNRLAGNDDFYGISMTKLNPYEEYTYQQWVKGLTPNLKGSAEDKNYDMRGAWKSGEQPELFYNDEQGNFQSAHPIDVNQQGSIYEPHLFSRNPNTGKMLKGPNHETFMHALEGDIKAGFKVKMDLKTGDMYTYEKGGNAESTVEIERSERVYTPNGKLIMETPADAPTHEEGGVKVTLPAGSLVFPKKYYKALDAASGLPAFKKITKTMLDNAEKAYLRGEPYSSGGKRQ